MELDLPFDSSSVTDCLFLTNQAFRILQKDMDVDSSVRRDKFRPWKDSRSQVVPSSSYLFHSSCHRRCNQVSRRREEFGEQPGGVSDKSAFDPICCTSFAAGIAHERSEFHDLKNAMVLSLRSSANCSNPKKSGGEPWIKNLAWDGGFFS